MLEPTTREQRIRATQAHLLALTPEPDLIRAITGQWGIAESTARKYIQEARVRIDRENQTSRDFLLQDHAAIIRQQLRSLAKATDRRDRQLLLQFLQYEAQLHGLLTPPKLRHQEILREVASKSRSRRPSLD